MSAKHPYQVAVYGTASELRILQTALAAAPERFELQLGEPEVGWRDGGGKAQPLDVAVVTAGSGRPLPIARHVRTISANTQIVFLLPEEELDRLRATLPFVPDLASAWTGSIAGETHGIGQLVSDAAHAARQRSSTAAVFARVNEQLRRKAAPAEARRSQLALSERYLATILAQSPDAFIAADRAGTVIAHNDAAHKLFGPVFERNPPVGLVDLFVPEERRELGDLVAKAAEGQTFSGIELQLDTGGDPPVHVELSLAPVRGDAGGVASVSITVRDVTGRKRAEQQQRLLINELNHRVKNTLAIVQALARQSFKGGASPAEEQAAFSARLAALAAAHDLLTRQTWEPVPLAQLVRATFAAAFGADPARQRVEGPEVRLKPQAVISVALVLHELCTNAIKYGALSNDTGVVSVRWHLCDDRDGVRLRLAWSESGGPPVELPSKRGFGSRMIERGFAAELAADVKLEFNREGVSCTIDAPLSEASSET